MEQRPLEIWSLDSQDELAALEAFTFSEHLTLRLDDFLQSLALRLAQLQGASVGAIYLLDDRGSPSPRALQHADAEQLDLSACLAPRLAARLAREGRCLALSNIARGGSALDPGLRESGLTAILGSPLRVRGQVMGCVYLGFRTPRVFTARELRKFGILADRVAISIDHIRLLQESRRHAADLERMNEELRAVDQLKSEFLSMVSHELRTPLTAIIGYTDLLLKQVHGSLNERQLQYQTAVRTGAQRLLALVNDLLDVSRLESGRLELDRQPVDVSALLRRSLESVQSEARARGVALHLTARQSGDQVLADAERIFQVVNHLLSNALKFTPSGGQVWIGSEGLGPGEILIWVRDTGQGIAREQLDRIWDRFYQGDGSLRRVHGGAGVGLSIVRRVVEMHGGRVWAESDGPGEGSTFSFTLPLARPQERPAPVVVMPPPGRRTLLLVEDDAANRDVVRTIAETLAGFQVQEAEHGREALALAEQLRPDVIVLDLMIPGIDGFEVARRLKADARLSRIPILALSGLAHAEDREHALAAGADAYLSKPFRTEELADLLTQLLSSPTVGMPR